MKTKYFILLLLFSFIMTGCNLPSYNDREEVIVSKILKSQRSIHEASLHTNNLLSTNILYAENYTYADSTINDILSLQLHIGDITLAGNGYDRFTMSNVILDFDLDNLTQDYIYDYQGYMYDYYYDRYQFTTAQSFVGTSNNNPYKGLMYIVGENETMIVSVVDEYYVDIAVYDHYDSYHDRVIHSSWKALGF